MIIKGERVFEEGLYELTGRSVLIKIPEKLLVSGASGIISLDILLLWDVLCASSMVALLGSPVSKQLGPS